MSNYRANKELAKTRNTDPTLTDQSQAMETDINVIVKRYGVSGQVPTGQGTPMYGDYTQLPNDLREFIETARTLSDRYAELPPQLQGMNIEELMALTPAELTNILTPPNKEATDDGVSKQKASE